MSIVARIGGALLMPLLFAASSLSQQSEPTKSTPGKMTLDVVVTPKSGHPVGDLQQQDFTLLDNKAPASLKSFKAVSGREAPIEVVLVIDAVNTGIQNLGYGRQQVSKFLRSESGPLAYPMAIVFVTDTSLQMAANISSDGNALATALEKIDASPRILNRDSGYFGDVERWQLSLKYLQQLITAEAPRSGRRIMLWVSPGWPLMSGVRTQLDAKQQQQIFGNIVSFSTQLLQDRITLYTVNPLGTNEGLIADSYYQDFVKGATKPSQVFMGDLGLQVLSIQSGGLVLNASNDVAGLLRDCISDVAPYYEITFDPPATKQRDEYHRLEVKVSKPGLTARTRQGYYAQP
jgi:VWFA-related protein